MDRSKLILAACLLAAGLIGFFTVINRGSRDDPPPLPPDPPGTAAGDRSPADTPTEPLGDLVRLANRAVGQLENNNLDAAAAAFAELSAQLPNEVLGPRNLAISQLLAYEEGRADRSQVDEALQQLARLEPDSAVTHWLKARASLKSIETGKATDTAAELSVALDSLSEAARLDPRNIVYQFGLFEAGKSWGDQTDAGYEALRAAYQLAPENLFLLPEWLLVQAQRQDPEVAKTLAAAKQTIAPLQRKSRYDLLQFADDAIAAAEEENWSAVTRTVRRAFMNAMRNDDMTKSDARQLHPHPLEFVVRQFSDALLRKVEPPAAELDPPTVSFTPFAEVAELPAGPYLQLRLVDVDLDERLDLLVLRDDHLLVLRQTEQGSWQRLTSVELPTGCVGLLAADLDHDRSRQAVVDSAKEGEQFDADADVVVYGAHGVTVLRNDWDAESGSREFQIVQQPQLSIRDVTTGILVDFDHDSDLDLVVSTGGGLKALRAEGRLAFADVSEFSLLPDDAVEITSLVAVDWDHDVDIDVIASSSGSEFGYLENLRHGNFRWVPFDESFDDFQAVRSVALLDADGNLSWDLCTAGGDGLRLTQTASAPNGSVRQLRTEPISSATTEVVRTWDFDNDSYRDLLAWGGGSVEVHRGIGDGRFVAAEDLGLSPGAVISCDVGDIDNDGDQDLAVLTGGGVTLYRNDGGNQNPWLQVRALGQVDNKGKVNHNGIGSLLEVRAGMSYQAQVVERPITHFGLGPSRGADVLRFLWTNGIPQAIVTPQASQSVCEPMELKGSCPYLFAWDGARFSFVTDLLWAAPLGLQVAEGELAPSRPWEYLLVNGDQLKAADGRYELRVTEELWEAAYFDQIQLLAVDHPAEVSVFSNEKVGPASIAKHKIHTAQDRRVPVAARDKHGRDVLDLVCAADGKFFQGFERNLLPGLVDEHFLELDLGKLDAPEQVLLFLTGWIYPTDTSLNIAISQDADLAPPRPPSIQVPDGHGDWREVVPYMGFPGGKTKTIVVDLSSAFLTDDFRLRITTSAQIYWDRVFFTVDEPAAQLRVTPLSIDSAELRYRGFSRAVPQGPRAPAFYDYEQVTTDAKWPPMQGYFTRYGQVTELLSQTDDKLVVLASGDELAVSFLAPAEDPPPGWQRDFILHNVGWDKDADLNTIYGQSVEPLPFVDMSSYPYIEDGPSSEDYRRYLREYQRRRADARRYWRRVAEPVATGGGQ